MSAVNSTTTEFPRLGVHDLAAFTFCTRAGILSVESKRDDDGLDIGLANLDYSHPYDLLELQRELAELLKNWTRCLVFLCLMATFQYFVGLGIIWLVCLAAEVFVIKILAQVIGRTYDVFFSLKQFNHIPAAAPNAMSSKDESINWWAMRAEGFAVIKPKSPFHDEQANLIGRPWRLLRKGTMLIPVFRTKKPDVIREQHRVRIAAYCHLIETCEGSTSPYGVILGPEGYDGLAVKATHELDERRMQVMMNARHAISQSATSRIEPGQPRNELKCRECWYARLMRHQESSVNLRGEVVQTKALISTSGNEFHSRCGDRFDWRPPHEDLLSKTWKPG